MRYEQVKKGIFLARPNRFIAHVLVDDTETVCHVKNTGRCRELLVPGARVTLAVSDNAARKTRCDLVAVEKGSLYINMDSQAPNRAAGEALPRLFPGLTLLRPETKCGDSRLDFYLEAAGKNWFVEVKGVTLEEDGLALFPDAPTERGVRHLRELACIARAGGGAAALFVIQMKGLRAFSPNQKTHPAFAQALCEAREAGVRLMAYDCLVTPRGMTLDSPVPIVLP